jgi:antitoxin ParD1/3/4
MTAKPTVSLTDQGYDFARSLVAKGRFASLSAVLQHGLTLVAREEDEHEARLAAIRADLERRAAQPSLPTEEMDRRLAAWRARREAADAPDDLA